jgi:O-antigen/teichoic acid export membrane protein
MAVLDQAVSELPVEFSATLRPSRRRLVSNTLAQLVVPGARMVLGVGLLAALSRYLGVVGLGEYGLVLGYVAVFNGVFNEVGLGTICLREISSRPERRRQLVCAAASLQLLVSVAAYGLLLLSVLVLPYPRVVTTSIAIYGVSLLTTAVGVLALPFQAELRMSVLLAPSLAGVVLNVAFALAVISISGSFVMLVAAALAAVLLQHAWTAGLSLRLLGRDFGRPHREWGRLVRQSLPLAFTTMISTLVQQGPLLALSLVNLRALGIFVAAAKLPQQLVVLPIALRGTTFPMLSAAWAVDRPRFQAILSGLIRWTVLVVVPVAVTVVALADPFVRIIFGPAFLSAVPVLVILVAVAAMVCPGILIGEALLAAGFQQLALKLTLACFPVLLVGLVLLAPAAGAVGAALAVLAFNIALFAATLLAARRRMGTAVPVGALVEGLLAAAVGLLGAKAAHAGGPLAAALAGGLTALAVLTLLNHRRVSPAFARARAS